MADGWIKLHRKLTQSQMYRNLNSKQRDVMMQCLLLANHRENEWEWGAETYCCKPGEFITSLENLRLNCAKDVSVQSIRTALLKLVKWGFLTDRSTKTGRLISVVNWALYQELDNKTNKDINKEPTKAQQRLNKELTTNKNDKNEKNEKKEEINRDKPPVHTKSIPPTFEEVRALFESKGRPELAEKFWHHYESIGWYVGEKKMTKLSSAIAGWILRQGDFQKSQPKPPQQIGHTPDTDTRSALERKREALRMYEDNRDNLDPPGLKQLEILRREVAELEREAS